MKKLTFGSQLATVAAVGTLMLAMTGCATKPTYQPPSSSPTIITNAQGVPNYHRVQRGDTVSQIASRYRLDYRQVGALNGLDSQYTIYSGQMLKLWQGGQNQPVNSNTYPASSNPTYNSTPNSTQPNPTTNPAYGATAAEGYGYPSANKVVRNFNEAEGSLGMWFEGKEGDPVFASHDGAVLYAGNGLAEYGNLIMIRHSDSYITAYGHNSQILVKEGDTVKRGQHIASMGNTGQTDKVALEFQLRLAGNPIDPLTVLGR